MRHLFNDLYLEVDRLNFIVFERIISTRGNKIGKEKFVNPAYFTTVRTLKKYLIERYSILNIHNIDVEEFFTKLDRIMRVIESECEM